PPRFGFGRTSVSLQKARRVAAMKPSVAALVFAVAASGLATGAAAESPPAVARLVFHQIGPADASLAPFTIACGSGARSAASTLVVSHEKFDQLLALFKRHGGAARETYPAGSLRVDYFEDNRLAANYGMPPDAMPPIVMQLVRMFASAR
ncbi:MAG: hypothetical protein NTW28_33395, partial [Candidatus Solibacter sp.]|nr:hypothetical protein [Candidatus Solibacter sp.]